MSSILDLLVKSNYDPSLLPEKELEVKRLSEIIGEPFVFRIRALQMERLEQIRREADNDFMHRIILESIVEPNFASRAIMEKYGCTRPLEVIAKIFLPGEINGIFAEIQVLSGYGGVETVEEIKKK